MANRILLKFAQSPTAETLSETREATAASYLEPLGSFGWYRLDSASDTTAQLLQIAKSLPTIAKAEPDTIGHVAAAPNVRALLHRTRRRPFFDTTPNDQYFGDQWALQNTGQDVDGITGTSGDDIGAAAAWDHGTGSASIVIGDLDTGIDYTHPDLAANMWSAPHAYTITEGGNVYNCPQGSHGFNAIDNLSGCDGQEADGEGHGTATAGVMGAVGNNGIGVAGVNWTTSIVSLVAVPPDLTTEASEVVTAIDAGLQIARTFGVNLRVMNMSFMTATNDGGNGALEDEMAGAAGDGVMFTAATGNNCDAGDFPPASFNLANEIAVAASDQFDHLAVWSGGQCSDGGGQIAAPGKNIYTTEKGGGINGGFGGTSASTPYVAGAAALLMADCPLPNPSIIATLEGTADQISWLTGIATDGRRLDIAAAVNSCLYQPGATQSTDTVTVGTSCRLRRGCDDYGYITISIDGQVVSSYSYNASYDTPAAIAQGLVGDFRTPYATAVYGGGSKIIMTTTAYGSYTGYTAFGQVVDQCSGGCPGVPTISVGSSFTGGQS